MPRKTNRREDEERRQRNAAQHKQTAAKQIRQKQTQTQSQTRQTVSKPQKTQPITQNRQSQNRTQTSQRTYDFSNSANGSRARQSSERSRVQQQTTDSWRNRTRQQTVTRSSSADRQNVPPPSGRGGTPGHTEPRTSTAKRILANTGRAAGKGVQDSLTGFKKTMYDIGEMASQNERSLKTQARRQGINFNDQKKMSELEARHQKAAETAKQERVNLQAEQEKRQEEFDKRTKGAKGLEKALYNATESGAGMLTDLAVGALTGTGELGALASMGARTYGQTRGQAEKEGATENEDRLNALLQAGKEVGTERVLGVAGLPSKAYGKGALSFTDRIANKLTSKLAGRTADVVGAGARLAGGVAEENIEELLGWGLDPVISEVAYKGNVRGRRQNEVRSQLQEESNALRSQVTDETTARTIATYLSSDKFIEENKKDYMSSGLSEKQAQKMAEQMRDYLTASLTGDTEEMERLEQEMATSIAGKGLSKESWDFGDLAETVAATTLLTASTGMPGSVSSTVQGNRIKNELGENGIKALAKTAIDFEDAEMSEKAQVMSDRIASGKEITATQAYDLQQGMAKQIQKDQERVNASYDAAAKEMQSKELVSPYEVTEDGSMALGEVTGKKVMADEKTAKTAIQAVNKENKDDARYHLSASEVQAGANAIAAFQSGIMTEEDANAFNYTNQVVRTAFTETTGIDLDQYIVKKRNGQVDIPATNAATKDALFVLNTENLVASAEAETANWMDVTRGEVVTNVTARMGASGTDALQQVLDKVDERDRSQYMLVSGASDLLYQSARNIGTEWNLVSEEFTKMFPEIDSSDLKSMYEAGLTDRMLAEDEVRNRTIEAGKPISEMGEQETATGNLFVDTKEPPKGTVVQVFTELAKNLGADIHLVDHIKTNGGREANGAYSAKSNTFWINVNNAPEKNVGYIFMHECTHYLKAHAPEQYHKLENLVREKWFNRSPEQMQSAIAEKISLYKGDQKLTEEEALEEIIADAAHEFLTDPNFASQIAEEDPTLAKAVLDSIKRVLRVLRRIFAGGNVTDETYMNCLFSELDIMTEAEALWLDAYKAAVKNRANMAIDQMAERSYSISDTSNESFVTLSPERINSLISEYAIPRNKTSDYSKAWIATIDPRDFLKLTVRDEVLDTWEVGTKNAWGQEVRDLDKEDLKDTRLMPYLKIDTSESHRVIGHEGRHRMLALYRAGYTEVPVVIQDINEATKNNKQPMEEYDGADLWSQDFGNGPVNDDISVEVYDTIPINEKNRAEIERVYGSTSEDQVKFSITPQQKSELNDNGIEELEDGTTARYSLPSWNNTDKAKKLKALVSAGHNERTAKKWIKDVNSIASIILSNVDRLDYLADPNQRFLKDNGDYYKKTLDASTLCDKRRIYQGTYDAIQHALPNTPLMEEDVIKIRTLLKRKGYVSPCGICYVESQRKTLGTYAKQWYDNYERKGEISLDDVTTTDGLAELKRTNPQVASDFEKAMKAKGVQSPKVVELRTDYREDIMRMKESTVQYLNKIGGLRFHSFSDFESVHLIDTMQAIMDMATKNLNGMAYTKVPNFVAVFGPTGIKINLSLIVKTDENGNAVHDKDGRLVFDTEEGISYEEAKKWRDEYPDNVAFILVGKDMKNTLEALNDDRIDYVIPFHKSKWSNENLKKLGLNGYVDFATGHQDNKVFVSEYWDYKKTGKENAEAYLKKCAERGVKPVFEQLLVDNGDGSYSLQPDHSTDNYWKLLVEGKMYNHKTGKGAPQKPVKPNFNMEEARRVLNEYKGGADTLPVANDVVNEFVTEYLKEHPEAKTTDIKLSISAKYDEPYMAAVNAGDMDEAQRLVDEAARESGMRVAHRYHGSMNANFTVFYKSYAKVGGNSGAGFYFSTDKDDSLSHYQDVEGADNYFKWSSLAEQIGNQIDDGTWEGPEFESWEDIEEYAKKELNKNPGTYDVYLNYKNPYLRDYRNSTNIYDKIIEDFDESDIDRDDYDTDDDYDDALYEAKIEHIYKAIDSAVIGANSDLESNYEVLGGPTLSDIVSELANHAYEWESLTWSDIEDTLNQLGTTEVTNYNWTEDADANPEFTRAIIENFGYDAIEDKEVSSKFGQLSREMMTDTEHIIVFKPEQIKLSDPVTYAEDGSVIPLSERFDPNNNDIRYSMPTQDSDGNILTDGQMEYFKNSQARDRDGKLAVVYHSSLHGGFTVFDPMRSDVHRSLFFTNNLKMSRSYLRGRPGGMIDPYDESRTALRRIDDVGELPDFISYDIEKKVRDSISNIVVTYTATATGGEAVIFSDDFVEAAEQMLDYMEGYRNEDVINDIKSHNTNEINAAWQVFADSAFYDLEYQFNYRDFEQKGTYSCYLKLDNPMIVDGKGSYWNAIRFIDDESQEAINNAISDLEEDTSLAVSKIDMNYDSTEDGWPTSVTISIACRFKGEDGAWHDDTIEENYSPEISNYTNANGEINHPDLSADLQYWVWNQMANLGIDDQFIEEQFDNTDDGTGEIHWISNTVTGYEWFNEFNEWIGEEGYLDEDFDYDSSYYDTRDLAEIASSKGYDGVIIRNLVDYGSHGYGNEPGDVYIAFSAEQVKDIHNEDPTENPDIRYSMTPEEDAISWIASQFDLDDVPLDDEVAEEGRIRMAKSKDEYIHSRNLLWNERWLTEGKVLDEDSVKGKVRQLVMGVMANSDTSRKYKTDLVNRLVIDLKSAFWMLKDGKAMEAEKLLWDSAVSMIEDVDFVDDTTYKNYKELREYLRKTSFQLGEEYWQDVDYQNFRKRNFGRIKLVKGETNIDKVYTEMKDLWPEFFNEEAETTVPDQLLHIEEVLDEIQPYRYAYSSEEAADLAYDIASDLWVIIYEGEQYSSVADTYKNKYDEQTKAMKARHEEALRAVREDRDRKVVREKRKFKEYKEKKKSAKERAKYFGRISKNIDWLTNRLINETKDKNIPEKFRQSLAQLLSQLDTQTERSKKLEAKYGPAKKTLEIRKLRDHLKEIASEDDTGVFRPNEYVEYLMEQLAEKVDGYPIDFLDTEDLMAIDLILRAIRHEISNYTKVRLEGKKVEIASIGDKTIHTMKQRIEKYGKRKTYGGAAGQIANLLNEGEQTPIYLFERLDPTGEGIGAMYKELRRGEDKHIQNMQFLRERFGQMFGDYFNKKKPGSKLEKWRNSEQEQTFNLSNGSITLNPAQMMSLYCLSKRPQALGHILGSGIVASPVNTGQKLREKVKGKTEQVNAVRVTYEEVQHIISQLTEDQIKLADEMQSLMNNEMAAWGNETSLDLHGIKLFREKDYFPIKTSGESLNKSADSFDSPENIKNFGFTKPLTRNANNAIMLDDIFSVVADHCNKMSLYNAMAVPISDFMRVYNYKQRRDDGTVKTTVQAMIGEAFTRSVNQYIMKFIADVNANTKTRSDAVNDLMNKALANYKKASIGANFRVALQQPTAIFRSFMAISPKYFVGVKISRKEMREMFEHCPIAQWKSWGHYDMDMGRDVEDIMMNNDWSKMDVVTMSLYGELDNLTWSMIWQASKNKVKAEHPDVEVGSDKFFKLANEVASEVFDKTQVVDSIFHRSDTMRSKNTITKMATSFMAEPTLTYNVFRDSVVNAYEAWKDGNHAEAVKLLSKMSFVLALNAAAVSASAAIWDAVRGKSADGDDDKKWTELWYENFIENFKDNANMINNIYFVKDIYSLKDGWGTSNMALEGWETLFKGIEQIKKKIEKGDEYINRSTGKPYTWYDVAMTALGGVGYITGVPIKTTMRDAKAIMKKLGIDVYAETAEEETVETDDSKTEGFLSKFLHKDKTEEKDSKDTEAEIEAKVKEYEDGLGDKYSEDQKKSLVRQYKKTLKTEVKPEEDEEDLDYKFEMMAMKAEQKATEYSGADLDDALWDVVGDGYSKKLEEYDFEYIAKARAIYKKYGGDPQKFDAHIVKGCKSAYKKTFTDKMTDQDIYNQDRMRVYMLDHGVTPEEISDMCYHTDAAKDLKAALRMNNDKLIMKELVPLVRAGLTRSDWEKLVKYQNYGAKTYDGKYSGPEYKKSTGTYVWPTQGQITSGFGYRRSPTAGASSNHPAIDIGAPQGSPVVAADGGKIIKAGNAGGYGNQVAIQHENGTVTYYSHLYSWNVKPGDTVAQGQQIGQVGSTGISTGPHLDFKVEVNGTPVNPLEYLS